LALGKRLSDIMRTTSSQPHTHSLGFEDNKKVRKPKHLMEKKKDGAGFEIYEDGSLVSSNGPWEFL
jgi:hypothetical protein